MQSIERIRRRRQINPVRTVFLIFLAAIALVPAACSKKAAVPQAATRRYQLVGKVVSIDKDQASVMVDGKEIVGFMDAMTMAYPVGDGKGSAGTSNPPKAGDKVPDFAMVNQDGKQIHLRDYQGDVLLVTFIYTRCPFPDYCPLVSRNFSRIYASLRKDP